MSLTEKLQPPANRLTLLRLHTHPSTTTEHGYLIPSWPGHDYVAPLVDGESVGGMCCRHGGATPSLAIPYELVAPPSRHWLGEPDPRWVSEDGAVFLTMDSQVEDPLPDGIRAVITLTDKQVTWDIASNPVWTDNSRTCANQRTFHFQRSQYESELAKLTDAAPVAWDAQLRLTRDWWGAVGD